MLAAFDSTKIEDLSATVHSSCIIKLPLEKCLEELHLYVYVCFQPECNGKGAFVSFVGVITNVNFRNSLKLYDASNLPYAQDSNPVH